MLKFLIKILLGFIVLFALWKVIEIRINANDKARAEKSLKLREKMDKRDKEYKAKLAKEDALRTLYDPNECKTDAKGMVYWASGTHVFRFPFQPDKELYSRRNTRFETYVDIPNVDQSELEGCPSNPITGGDIPYLRDYIDSLWKEVAGGEKVKRTWGGSWLNSISGRDVAAASYDIKNYERRRKRILELECIERVEGFQECFNEKSTVIDPLDLRGRTIRISYLTPDLQKIEIYGWGHLLPHSHGTNIMVLRLNYFVYDVINVTVSVELAPEKFPLAFAYENKVRTFLQQAHIQSFAINKGVGDK